MRLRVVHWNAKEAAALVALLETAGHSVDITTSIGSGIMKYLRAAPPDAVVIDLTRQPSHGREIAVAIRNAKTLKHLPILFVDGQAEKVAAIARWLPDAIYTTRARLLTALRRAKPLTDPARPAPMMERFGNRTTAQKLGIGAGMCVEVVDPPPDFERAIGNLPEGATLEEHPHEPPRLTLWFTHDPDSMLARMRRMRAVAGRNRLWILWRKNKRDGLDGGLIRAAGIDVGLVDYKVCSVNEAWSGMAFAVKKSR
jgi:CheY-like chemotaxis protein